MPGKDDDQDLADLLPSNGTDVETVPLTKPNLENGSTIPAKKGFQPFGGLCGIVSAHLSYLCFAYPSACGCFACIISLILVAVLVINMVNPTMKFGEIPHDWATVNSAYELDVSKIDHWCLGGGNEGCRCEDPLQPASRVELRSWTESFKENKHQIGKYMDDPLIMADLDVAIVGESAVEEMDGRWMGKRPDDELRAIGTIFKKRFAKEKGAKVEGIALGVAGDSANNVLWRLMHGEMPPGFEPKIWWVHVGMNDLTRQQCSEEVVVLGVLRVVEEILNKRPNAKVVINSLLPMADLRGGTIVTEKDYRDAFNDYKGKRESPTRTAHYVKKNIDGREQILPAASVQKDEDKDKKRKKKKNKEDRHHHNRQLLEYALEDYDAVTNDNSEYIEMLQRELEQDWSSMVEEDAEDGMLFTEEEGRTSMELDDNHMHRRLDDKKRQMDEIRKRIKREKRDRYNPTIDQMKSKQKKYNFFRNRRMPLWTSIHAINRQLFKFCEKHERVVFFDATNIFAERQSDGRGKYYTLLSDNISARGHPTEVGYAKWEDAMVKKIRYLLDEMRKESPELFMAAPKPPAGTTGGGGGGGSRTAEGERLKKKPMVDENRGNEMAPAQPEEPENENGAAGTEGDETDVSTTQFQEGAGMQQQSMTVERMQQRPKTRPSGGSPMLDGQSYETGSAGTGGTGQASGVPSSLKKKKKKKLGSGTSTQMGGLPSDSRMSGGPMQPGFGTQPGSSQMSGGPMQPGFGTQPGSSRTSGGPMQPGYGTQPGSSRMSGGPMQPGYGTQPGSSRTSGGPMRPGSAQFGGSPMSGGQMQPDSSQMTGFPNEGTASGLSTKKKKKKFGTGTSSLSGKPMQAGNPNDETTMQGNSYGTASRPQQPFAQGAGNTQLGVGAADEDAADEETVGGDAEAGQVPDAEDDGDDDGTAAEERTGGNTEEGVAGETAEEEEGDEGEEPAEEEGGDEGEPAEEEGGDETGETAVEETGGEEGEDGDEDGVTDAGGESEAGAVEIPAEEAEGGTEEEGDDDTADAE